MQVEEIAQFAWLDKEKSYERLTFKGTKKLLQKGNRKNKLKKKPMIPTTIYHNPPLFKISSSFKNITGK